MVMGPIILGTENSNKIIQILELSKFGVGKNVMHFLQPKTTHIYCNVIPTKNKVGSYMLNSSLERNVDKTGLLILDLQYNTRNHRNRTQKLFRYNLR